MFYGNTAIHEETIFIPYRQPGRQCHFLTYSNAVARIAGGPDYPNITGLVFFRNIGGGTHVSATIYGLPAYKAASDGKQPIGPFGFHIHEHGNCEIGDPAKPFSAAGEHWNPDSQPHGNHANREHNNRKTF